MRKEKYENDGTSSSEDVARVHIQSEAGVQRYGLLTFSYPSATGTFEIGYVRVRKPDGSVVETPPDSVQDMPADITRAAPFYSDLHEKHVAVKGLSVGDVLEFQTMEHTTKPLAPGQFWTFYRFTRDQIILDEQLEISVPAGRVIKIKSESIQPTISEAGGYRIYRWHNANPVRKDDSDAKKKSTEQLWQQARGRLPEPDILLSSFSSWDEVGHWYGALQADRVQPTPEITAKALELTKNAPDQESKIRALYAYVSTNFRYIGVAFGIGRYQPHSAAEVLSNQYGDCKDKHTLLASLLTAVGIPAYPALISTTQEVDDSVPSPGQFDHVITIAGSEHDPIWLDTTAEVGPYRYLVSPLRDKRALAIWKDRAASLVRTPAELPFASIQTFNMDAKLSDAGTLEGQADYSVRGDTEFLLRSVFRAVPLAQWKELGQRISFSSGFGGEVSDVTAGSPEKTEEPFHFSYKYTRKNFGDWSNQRIVAPSPSISLLAPADEELLPSGPLWLGPRIDIQFHSSTELPAGYEPQVPAAIHLKKDFATYDSTYEFKSGKLVSERHLKTLLEEVPAGEHQAYLDFMKAVGDDYGAFIPLTKPNGAIAGEPNPVVPPVAPLASMPDSPNQEAERLEQAGRDEMAKGDSQGAISSLYRAVSADPKFVRAWVTLGSLLFAERQVDAGTDAFQKAIALDPAQPSLPKTLGRTLMASGQLSAAVPVWQNFMKAHPDDADGPVSLGATLELLQRYSEAATAYQSAARLKPSDATLQARLASMYLHANDRDKAEAIFAKLGAMTASDVILNDTAFEMANNDLDLPVALDYAQRAVRAAETESQKITLPTLSNYDLTEVLKVAASWDTLGWVNERMSKLDVAEQYLRASWRLTQNGVAAGHLCHLYRRTHQRQLAIEMCRLALNRLSTTILLSTNVSQLEVSAARENLSQMNVAISPKNVSDASDKIVQERRFDLPRFLPGTESAEFFVLLTSDAGSKTFKVNDVKFISGSEKMKRYGQELKSINFGLPAPPAEIPTRVIRRGILGCYQYTGCSFVVLDPEGVRSVK